jgi:kynurenine formamidase
MQVTLAMGGRDYARDYSVDVESAQDISIPVRFDGPQLTAFGAAPATSAPLRAGSFVGSVAAGGSCNCGVHAFSPHTSGTHTECVGHITSEPLTILDALRESLVPATVITLGPVLARDCSETYAPALRPADRLLTAGALAQNLSGSNAAFHRGLIVRTLPNPIDKKTRHYGEPAPFFSTEAMQYLRELGVEHLLVDLPSVDRMDDDGMLSNHRVFWSVAMGSKAISSGDICARTITELIYVPDAVADGVYLLNLQVAPIAADAAPSRPLLYPVRPL